MRKQVTAVSYFSFLIALVAAAPAFAQTYGNTDDQYLRTKAIYPQEVHTNNAVVYPADQYPTAQGRYLSLPPGYQQPNREAASTPAYYPSPPVPPMQQPRIVAASPSPPQYQTQSGANTQLSAAPVAPPSRVTSLDQLPSYTYDRNLDPRYAPKPPRKELPDSADHIGLGTRTGGEVGLQISSYRYQEFDPSGQRIIRITGPDFGATLAGYKAYNSGWFYGGDLRVAYGTHDYTGGDINLFTQAITPSTHDGISDWTVETRAVVGHDFIINGAFWNAFNMGLSPYLGLGFRFLYDDMQGNDSNGVPGYERYSHYFYLPIGITPRFRLTDKLRLSLNMEFDELLYGWQVSSIGEAIPGETDITDMQNTGYGLRGSVMFEWPSWSLGPYFNYWDIGQSTTDCDSAGGACGFEPHNQTIEFGVEGRYKF